MSKLETMEKVAEMVGLNVGYVVEAAAYFRNFEEAFNWIYLSEENPNRPYEQNALIKKMSSITVEDLQDEKVNSVIEYMVYDDTHTYITDTGIAYLRIIK